MITSGNSRVPRSLATVDFWSSPDKYKDMSWLKGKTSKQNKHHYSTNIPIIKQTELSNLSKNKFTVVFDCNDTFTSYRHLTFIPVVSWWKGINGTRANIKVIMIKTIIKTIHAGYALLLSAQSTVFKVQSTV